MLTYMMRTTLRLPGELDAHLRQEAQRRGITISELTREAIESRLGRRGRADMSERIEEILASWTSR